MDTLECTSPTRDDVKNYFLEKGYYPQLIDQAMKHVDYEFGSWRGFYTFIVNKMENYMKDYSSIRQIANGC